MAEAKKTNEEKVIPVENIPVEKEKKVTIILPRGREDEETGHPVWVNNKRYLIKRGVPVEVPESVALILAEQDEMLQIAYEFQKSAASAG